MGRARAQEQRAGAARSGSHSRPRRRARAARGRGVRTRVARYGASSAELTPTFSELAPLRIYMYRHLLADMRGLASLCLSMCCVYTGRLGLRLALPSCARAQERERESRPLLHPLYRRKQLLPRGLPCSPPSPVALGTAPALLLVCHSLFSLLYTFPQSRFSIPSRRASAHRFKKRRGSSSCANDKCICICTMAPLLLGSRYVYICAEYADFSIVFIRQTLSSHQ